MFTGEIEAVDTVNNAYRVEFENPRLGIQTVADIEVMVSAIFVMLVKLIKLTQFYIVDIYES